MINQELLPCLESMCTQILKNFGCLIHFIHLVYPGISIRSYQNSNIMLRIFRYIIICSIDKISSLQKIPQFHLISWCINLMERQSFHVIHQKLCGNCAFPQNFHTRKLGEITVFYTVHVINCIFIISVRYGKETYIAEKTPERGYTVVNNEVKIWKSVTHTIKSSRGSLSRVLHKTDVL